MAEYYIPAQDSETEFSEKRSRFIGHVWHVETEEKAREKIAEMKAKYYDARHNCWCYLIREGGITRYSDDGEPQGTAGQPMLEVFRREGVENVCCVVTRYFGGILLGAGGLVRAYTHGAAIALEAAEKKHMTVCRLLRLRMDYSLYGKVSYILPKYNIRTEKSDFAENVTLTLLIKGSRANAFEAELTELTNGSVAAVTLDEYCADME